jgi:hypothetical protein
VLRVFIEHSSNNSGAPLHTDCLSILSSRDACEYVPQLTAREVLSFVNSQCKLRCGLLFDFYSVGAPSSNALTSIFINSAVARWC